MILAPHITVTPETRDGYHLAYSRGVISYETLKEKIRFFDSCPHSGVSAHPTGVSCTECGCDLEWDNEVGWYSEVES